MDHCDDLDPKYTEICSERTVQSSDNGFFREMFDSVCDACPPHWLQQTFGRQTDHVGSMRCVLPHVTDADNSTDNGATTVAANRTADVLWTILENVQPVYKPKDARFSVQRRREGDRLSENGDLPGALAMLNHAVVRAPPKGLFFSRMTTAGESA